MISLYKMRLDLWNWSTDVLYFVHRKVKPRWTETPKKYLDTPVHPSVQKITYKLLDQYFCQKNTEYQNVTRPRSSMLRGFLHSRNNLFLKYHRLHSQNLMIILKWREIWWLSLVKSFLASSISHTKHLPLGTILKLQVNTWIWGAHNLLTLAKMQVNRLILCKMVKRKMVCLCNLDPSAIRDFYVASK